MRAMSEEELRQIRGSQIAMVYQEPMASLNPTMKIGRIAGVIDQVEPGDWVIVDGESAAGVPNVEAQPFRQVDGAAALAHGDGEDGAADDLRGIGALDEAEHDGMDAERIVEALEIGRASCRERVSSPV